MKATTRFIGPGSLQVESNPADEHMDQVPPDDPPEPTTEPTAPSKSLLSTKAGSTAVKGNMVTTADHPAAQLLDSMANAQHRARAAEQEEWRSSHQHLVDQAQQSAQALRKVLHAESDFMAPLAKFQPWYLPTAGRRHIAFQHMDHTMGLWRGAERLLGQLEKVDSDVTRLSRMHPNGRADEFNALSRMIRNAVGADRVLVSTVSMARHLLGQLQQITRKAQP